MTLRYTRGAAFLNYVANHPDVRPWLGTDGESYVDMGVLLSLPGAFALLNHTGGFVFMPGADGAYEFHTQFLPEGRGRAAYDASLEAARLMFDRYGAKVLKTYVPHENRAALSMIQRVGFKRTHEDADNSYWALTKEDWQARTEARSPKMSA